MSQQENQENNNNNVNEKNNDDNKERNVDNIDNDNQSNNEQNIENNNNDNQNNQNNNDNNIHNIENQKNNNQNENNNNQNDNNLETKEEEKKKVKFSDENIIQNTNINQDYNNNNLKTENSQENESLLKNNETNKYKKEDTFSINSEQNTTSIPSKKKINKIKSILTHEYTINPSLQKLPIIFYIYVFLIFLNVILIYIIKPLSTIFYFIFFKNFNNTYQNELLENKKKVKKIFIVFGYLIIFLLPTFHFFTRGIYILVHHKGYLYKVYIFIILCIEIYFNLPLTFLYEENYYSIFYFKQQGIEILINPTLIFFPTDYILSYFEIIRNIVESVYFFILTIVLFFKIKDNIYQQFTLNFMIVTMILYASKFLGAIAMLLIKIFIGDSTKRPLKVNHKIWLEFEDKTRKEKKKN